MFYDVYENLCRSAEKAPADAARKLHILNTTLNSWKKGNPPSNTDICKIAKYFNVPMEYLLDYENPLAR